MTRTTTYPVVCERCGQTATCEIVSGARLVCPRCVALERAPQGETVRLFEPPPAQMPGQLDLSMPRWTAAEAKAEVRAMIADARDF